MWLMPPVRNTSVCIVLGPNSLTCSWIERQKKHLYIRAIRTIPLSNYEYHTSIIHNITALASHIKKFLTDYHLPHATIRWLLDTQQITEQFIYTSTMTPTPEDMQQYILPYHHGDYSYLYQNEVGKTVFYLTSIPYAYVLQIQTLAIAHAVHISLITTPTMALLSLYQHIKSVSFRHTQLHYDMISCKNNLAHYFTRDMLNRVSYIPSEQTDIPKLAYCLGLYLGADTYEKSHKVY